MKFLKYTITILLSIIITSCSDEDKEPVNEVKDLIKVQEILNENHIIELYTENGQFIQGYNDITIRIKDKSNQSFIENAIVSWNPVMHMVSKTHSCPKSEIVKVAGRETIYNGYIVFQMPENADEGWDLTFNYSINGVDYEAKGDISVPMSEKRVVTTFTGMDDVKYILALVEPRNPDVKINNMKVGLYKMENMMNFPEVVNYKVLLDPRMPSMGNHSSPNNEDLFYNSHSKMYEGKLSLTMTGYWRLNLILLNNDGDVLKGEEVTEEHENSSLYLELEF